MCRLFGQKAKETKVMIPREELVRISEISQQALEIVRAEEEKRRKNQIRESAIQLLPSISKKMIAAAKEGRRIYQLDVPCSEMRHELARLLGEYGYHTVIISEANQIRIVW